MKDEFLLVLVLGFREVLEGVFWKYGFYRRWGDFRVLLSELFPKGEVCGVPVKEDAAFLICEDDGREGGDAEGGGEGGGGGVDEPVSVGDVFIFLEEGVCVFS